MKIKSQIYSAKELYGNLSDKLDNSIKMTIIKNPKEVRSIDAETLILIFEGLKTIGFGSLILAFITSIKDIYLKKLELKNISHEKELDRSLEKEKLEYVRETEIKKIEENRKAIQYKGYVEIVGNFKNKLLKEGTEKKQQELVEKIKISFNDNSIKIPLNEEIKAFLIDIDNIINIEAIEEIIHIEKE